MSPVVLDFETASGADLKSIGGRAYNYHESTRVLCLVAKHGDHVLTWAPECRIQGQHTGSSQLSSIVELCLLHGAIGHNANQFDRHTWDRFIGVPVVWYDSVDIARAAGYPGKLNNWCKRLGLPGKDEAGSKILKSCMTLKWNGKSWHNRLIGPGTLKPIVNYCIQDVEQLEQAISRTPALPDFEKRVSEVSRRINDRGIGFDQTLATRISAISADIIRDSGKRIETLTEGAIKASDLRRPSVLYPWLTSRGVNLSNLRKETINNWIENPTHVDECPEGVTTLVTDVLRLRQCALRITGAKLERASAASINGRLYDLLVYGGAHTLRFSSRLVQVHNLPRGIKGLDYGILRDLSLAVVNDEAGRLNALPDDILSSLIRCTLVPRPGHSLIVADFNAIELRAIAHLAGQQNLLDAFAASRDPYAETAKTLGCDRQIAKVINLGGIYGLGAATFGTYAASNRVDLAKANLTPEQCINAFRSLYPAIAGYPSGEWQGRIVRRGGFWHRLSAAWKLAAIERESSEVGSLLFEYADGAVRIRFPSGRYMYYRNPRIEKRPAPWNGEMIDALVFDGVHGVTTTHGGKLAENVCQAFARDVLCETLMQRSNTVLHVHDEVVDEVDSANAEDELAELLGVMDTSPHWAPDFPIKAEGFISSRYAKEPLPLSLAMV